MSLIEYRHIEGQSAVVRMHQAHRERQGRILRAEKEAEHKRMQDIALLVTPTPEPVSQSPLSHVPDPEPPPAFWAAPTMDDINIESLGVPAPTIIQITKAVCRFYQISGMDMASARRTKNIVHPRQVAMWLCKTLGLWSLPQIGRRFGRRDHTTVLHAVRRIEAKRQKDANLQAELDKIIAVIEGARA